LSAEPFDLVGPLPQGITVLEASAGTGKTYTIEGLVARYVAEGLPLRRLLVVTFTRIATAELRDRVRRRLVTIADHLDACIGGGPAACADPIASLLAEQTGGDPTARRDMYAHLSAALTDFDAATISTIHGFCQQVLAGVGLTGEMDRQATLIEDERELIDAVVDDVLVRRFANAADETVRIKRADLRRIARQLIGNSDARIVPEEADAEADEAKVRVALAKQVVLEVTERKRRGALLSYDDLLVRLRDTLKDPQRGPAARERLRAQYDVALIDEFQDTDPVQWDILSDVFGQAGRSLVLIGDPKQAIYAFRGADVYAYLDAVRERRPQTLATNYRSDQGLLDAYNAVFRGATLGHELIAYREVAACDDHAVPRLVGSDVGTPLQLRLVTREVQVRKGGGKAQAVFADAARDYISRDVAAEVVRLLESDARITTPGRATDRVQPQDIAVLARSNAEAALVQRVLRDANVPAVINGVGSVFATAAAVDWLRLLEALEQPSSPSRARAAALSVFLGRPARWVAEADDDDLEPIHEQLRLWATVLRDRSVASLLQTIIASENLPQRVLALIDGERTLTDVEHIGELLHAAAIGEELGSTALSGWLRERIAEAAEDVEPDERARRLESDAEAVQVLTIHRSKGLEFEIVLCPFLWSPGMVEYQVPIFHDQDIDENPRSIDVGGGNGQSFKDHKEQGEREQRGEQLRLVYVALTRAKHQAIVWWAPVQGSDRSPLARLLFCRKENGEANPRCEKITSVPPDETARERLAAIAALAPAAISVIETPAVPPRVQWSPDHEPSADLAAAHLDRAVDMTWRRNSYSRITAVAHDEPLVATEAEQRVTTDEDMAPIGADGGSLTLDEEALRGVPIPLATMKGGVDVGTFVHGIFEEVDFTAADLAAEIAAEVDRQRERRPFDFGDVDMVDGLRKVIETPMGPLANGLALRDIGPRDRLNEMDFEFPLVGGLNARGDVTVGAIGELLAEHLPTRDPLRAYADRLRQPVFGSDLRGYLTGSIDLVLRLPGDVPRYTVVDYKTNWLASGEEPISAWHYRPSALPAAMERGHYPLQALLYSVALHRYLRWRQPGYDPRRNLGGVLYLFVRGMTGADVPTIDGHPCGVFSWQPPARLITELSDLLERGVEVAA
jgi:exodeoxyribonuclease V beta subunit